MFKLFLIASVCVAVVLCEGDQEAEITKLEFDNNPDGTFEYTFETSNGIFGQQSGNGGQQVSGSYKWISPEGTQVDISYVGDAEGGYRATGDAVPVAPEIPPHVIKLLEYIAAHPEESEDDGSYKP